MRNFSVVQLSGGLGNQLFQYAFGLYLKGKGKRVIYDHTTWFFITKKRQPKLIIDNSLKRANVILSFLTLLIAKLFKERYLKNEKKQFVFEEPNSQTFFEYHIGCWQHTEYLKQNIDMLIKKFKFDVENPNFEKLKNNINKYSVAIHVRRGDYVNNPVHETTDLTYFLSAIKIMTKRINNPTFYVFSDDMDWCKKNFRQKNINFIDCLNNQFEDFEALKLFKHKIISNSTFSWWACFLSDSNKSITICPKKWTNKTQKTSLQLSNWILN